MQCRGLADFGRDPMNILNILPCDRSKILEMGGPIIHLQISSPGRIETVFRRLQEPVKIFNEMLILHISLR